MVEWSNPLKLLGEHLPGVNSTCLYKLFVRSVTGEGMGIARTGRSRTYSVQVRHNEVPECLHTYPTLSILSQSRGDTAQIFASLV